MECNSHGMSWNALQRMHAPRLRVSHSAQERKGYSAFAEFKAVPCRGQNVLVGGLEYFLFFHILGIIIPFD